MIIFLKLLAEHFLCILSKFFNARDIEGESHVTINYGKSWEEFELWKVQKIQGLNFKIKINGLYWDISNEELSSSVTTLLQ